MPGCGPGPAAARTSSSSWASGCSSQGIAGSLYPEAWRLITAHLRAGHTVVLASSATRFQVEPAARALGVEHVLVSPVQIVDGICTGRAGGPLLWRAGKAAAVRSFAEEHDIDLARSYAYSNGDEDVPFLRTVGRPRALNPGRGLADAARHYSWPIARFRPRGRGGPRQLRPDRGRHRRDAGRLRHGGGDRRPERFPARGGRSGHRARWRPGHRARRCAAGRRGCRAPVQPAGRLPLQPPEPARCAGAAQAAARRFHRGGQEGLENTPGFGLAFRLADVAFVDRGDPAQARRALEPAVQRAARGASRW